MTEQSLAATAPARFSIGGVIAAAFRIIGRGFVPILIGAVGLSAVEFTVIFWFVEQGKSGVVPPWLSWLLVLTNTAGDALLNGFLVGVALSIVEDDRADWRRALARLPMVFLPVATLSAIYALLSRFGIPGLPKVTMLLVVVALGSLTWLYASVLVREGGNPLSALRRSLHLIGGHRWRIVALLAMMILLYIVFAFGGGMILGVVCTVLRIPVPLQAPIVIELVVTQILNVFCYAMAAASYHPLRYEKDGPEHIVVAQVFD